MGRRYREMQIKTASPVGLVLQMYEEAIRQVRRARESHEQGRIADRGLAVSRALGILSELRQSLDHEQGGEIARNLEALYLFVTERLIGVNIEETVDACGEILSVLEPLRSAWLEIAQRPDGQHVASVE